MRSDYRHLLIARFAVFNTGCLGLGIIATYLGWPQRLWAADASGISAVIAGVLAIGLISCGLWCWRIGGLIDSAAVQGNPTATREPPNSPQKEQYRLVGRTAYIQYLASVLVMLGFLGTLVGFIDALSGVTPSGVGDVASVKPMIATLIRGMGTAIYTTIAGIVANLWLSSSYRILRRGITDLLAKLC